jgi:DNA polymerase zeta
MISNLKWRNNTFRYQRKCNDLKIYKYKDDYHHQFFQDIDITASGWNIFKNWKNADPDSKRTRCKFEIITIYSKDNIVKHESNSQLPILTSMAVDLECCAINSYDEQVKEILSLETYQHLKYIHKINLYDRLTVHPLRDGSDPVTQIGISIKIGPPNNSVNEKNTINICLSLDFLSYGNIANYIDPKILQLLNCKTKSDDRYPKQFSQFIGSGSCWNITTNNTSKSGKSYAILYEDETSMMIAFFDLVKCYGPDIMYTFNGHNFDWPFMKNVTKRLGLYELFMMCGKMIGKKGRWKSLSYKSNQKGFNVNDFPGLIGMTFLDVMKFYQKLNDKNLKSLALNNISEYVLNDRKEDLSYKEMYKKIFQGGLSNIIDVCRYCIKDCVLLHRLDIASMILLKLITNSSIGDLPMNIMEHATSTKESVSILSKYAAQNETLIPISKYNPSVIENAYKYECQNNNQLKNEIQTILESTKKESFRKCRLEKHKLNWIKGFSHQGGYVVDSKIGIFYNVIVPDFSGFYPSVNRAYNISPDTIVLKDKYKNLEGVPYQEHTWTRINGMVESATVVNDIYNTDIWMGIIPKAHRYYTKKRNIVKSKMKELINMRPAGTNEEDIKKSFVYKALNIEQLTYKIKDNTIYGCTGQRYHPLLCRACAGLTTQLSRNLIKLSGTKAKEWYNAKVIYGDTDSIFIQFPIDQKLTKEEKFTISYKLGYEFVQRFNDHLYELNIQKKDNPIIKLTYEKQFLTLILTNVKKRYSGIMCCGNDINDSRISVMGHDYIKRNSPIICSKFGHMINNFALDGKMKKISKLIRRVIKDIYTGKYPNNVFIEGIKYIPPYNNPHNIKQARAVALINKYKPELTPAPNDRVWFTFKKIDGCPRSKIKKCDQVWPLKLLNDRELSKGIKIDYFIYIERIMKNNMHIFEIAFNNDKNAVKAYFYKYIRKYDDTV